MNKTMPKYPELHLGDQVFWTDPDEGLSSGIYTVTGLPNRSSTRPSDVLELEDKETGSEAEAYRHECS